MITMHAGLTESWNRLYGIYPNEKNIVPYTIIQHVYFILSCMVPLATIP